MDIYYGNCDNDIGLQTNEDFNEMKSLVQKLQAENSQLKDELKRENISHNYHCKESQRKNDLIDELQRKLDRAVEVLGFYAEVKNWTLPMSVVRGAVGSWRNTLAVEDCAFFNAGGGRARQAIKELRRQGE